MTAESRTRLHTPGASAYRVVQRLGRGGMADVQLVLQTTPVGVERLAVLKRARPELAQVPEYSAMFWEEARIAATLSHQNVVQTYEVGQDDDGYFMILEFLRGQSYAQVLSRTGYIDYRFSLEVLLGTLQGLEHAHGLKHPSGAEMSLVHRDISPPNLFVTYDGQIKVLDFGIAKARGSLIETEAGVVKGKVSYMAPEQMVGAACDLRTDLYAVGVLLWEATAGRTRFSGVPEVGILHSVTTQIAPTTPGAVERGLPALADEICQRALAFDPAERYQSASAFHDDLARLADLMGERLGVRGVGQHVVEHFAEERDAQQTLIEAELDPSNLTRHSELAAPATASASGTRTLELDSARGAAFRATPAPVPAESVPPLKASRISIPSVLLVVVGLGVLIVLCMKAGAYLSESNEHPRIEPSSAPATAPTNHVPAQPLVEAAVPSIFPPPPSAAPPEARPAPKAVYRAPWKPLPKGKKWPPPAPLDRQTVEQFGGRR